MLTRNVCKTAAFFLRERIFNWPTTRLTQLKQQRQPWHEVEEVLHEFALNTWWKLMLLTQNTSRTKYSCVNWKVAPRNRYNEWSWLLSQVQEFTRPPGCIHYKMSNRLVSTRLSKPVKSVDFWNIFVQLIKFKLCIFQEKDLIHKLFKVIVPRYSGFQSSFTQLYQLPSVYPGKDMKLGLLELKGVYSCQPLWTCN